MDRSRSRRTRRRWWALISVLLTLAAIAIAAEVVTRAVVRDRVADFVASEWGGTAETDLGSDPVLLQLLTGELSTVRVEAEGLSYRTLTGASAEAQLNGVRWDGTTVSATRSRMEFDVPASGLDDAIADALPGDLIDDVAVVPVPDSNQLELRGESEGAVTLLVTPALDGDTVLVQVDEVQVAGGQVPVDEALGDGAAFEIADLSDLPLRLSPSELSVTPGGVVLTLTSPDAAS